MNQESKQPVKNNTNSREEEEYSKNNNCKLFSIDTIDWFEILEGAVGKRVP